MSIISHKNKIIFAKTSKSASASFQIALSQFCGPDDIVTKLYPDELEEKYYDVKGLNKEIRLKYAQKTLHNAPSILHFLNNYSGDQNVDNYFKITIYRDPVEAFIRLYLFKYNKGSVNIGFSDWVLELKRKDQFQRLATSNTRYTLGVDFDRVLNYNSLLEDIKNTPELPDGFLEVFKSLYKRNIEEPLDVDKFLHDNGCEYVKKEIYELCEFLWPNMTETHKLILDKLVEMR